MTSCILATDMTRHSEQFARVKDRVEEHTIDSVFDYSESEDRQMCIDLIVHANDIVNPCLAWEPSSKVSFFVFLFFLNVFFNVFVHVVCSGHSCLWMNFTPNPGKKNQWGCQSPIT
jgi:hypothetical protein